MLSGIFAAGIAGDMPITEPFGLQVTPVILPSFIPRMSGGFVELLVAFFPMPLQYETSGFGHIFVQLGLVALLTNGSANATQNNSALCFIVFFPFASNAHAQRCEAFFA
jgi:hypothetical protein